MKHTNQVTALGARLRRVAANKRQNASLLCAVAGLWPSVPRLQPAGDTETPFYLNVVRPSLNRSKPYVPLQRVCPT